MGSSILSTDKITAVTRVQPPFTYECVFNPALTQDCQYGGINFDIFQTLMTILGLDYTLIPAEESTSGYTTQNGTWRGMLAQLDRGEANMTATLIAIRDYRLAISDFSVPVSYFRTGFIIKAPKSINIMEVPTKFIFAPFTFEEWWLILGSAVFVALILVIFARVISGVATWETLSNSGFAVIRSVLMQTHFCNRNLPPRIVFICFEISGFFLGSIYTSYLTSSLLVSVRPKDPFTGYDEFAQLVFDKKFQVITDDNPSRHHPITDKSDSNDPAEKIRIAYQWNPPVFVEKNDFKSIVEKIVEDGKLVYYGSYYHLIYATSKSCDVKVVVDTYTHLSWLAFAFPKGSKLQNLISSALHQSDTTVDSYLNRLYNRYANPRKCHSHRHDMAPSNYAPFGLWEMQGAFFVLSNGMLAAACVGIVEFVRWKCAKKAAQINHTRARGRLFSIVMETDMKRDYTQIR